MQHHKLAALKRRPDAVIIYSGHNEFAARFEEEREGWLDEQRGPALAATRLSRHLELRRSARWPTRSSARTGWTARRRLPAVISSSTRPLCSPSESAEILDDFRRRLEAIVVVLRPDRRLADLDRPAGQRGGL